MPDCTCGQGRMRWTLSLSAALAGALVFSDDVRAQTTAAADSAVRLEEVVVTASGFEQDRTNAPASITVIAGERLREQRSASLAEVLVDVEGVDVGGTAGKTGGLNIGMRGMPSDYTLVLIDGRRQNAAGGVTPNGFGETSTSFLPPVAAIERIEVIRGPMSTLYGSDAMGGVINIITRRVGQRWTGALTTDATVQQEEGFGNVYSGNAAFSGPVIPNLLGMSLRGSLLHRRESELSPTGEFGEATVISRRGPSPVQADVYSLGGRLTLVPHRAHELWADVDRARQEYDNSEAQLGTLDRPDAAPPTFNGYGPELRFNRDQASAGHTWRFGRGVLASSLMWNETETIGRTLPAGTPGGPPGSGAPNKTPGAARTLEARSTVLDSKLTQSLGTHMLTVGGQYWDAGMVDGVALQPFEYTQWSLFAEDEWRLAAPLALTLGLRRDDHSSFGGHVSPRAYLVWNATPEWTVKGGVSRGYKTPRVEQLVDGIIGFTAQGRTATIGSPGLKPETSTSYEAGIHFARPTGLSAGLTFFNNEFRDKITSGTPVPNCTFAGAPNLPGCVNYGSFPTQEFFGQSINVDEAVTRGVEAGMRVPFGVWSATANYTFTDSEQRSGADEGMPLTNTPRHMVNGSLRVRPSDRWDGWVRGEYRSERGRRTSAGDNPVYDALGDYRAYSLFHLGTSYEVGRGLSLSATVYNVLNTDFLEYASYQGTPTTDNPSGIQYASLYNNHQEGRRLWLSTTIQF
jgi:outer membrane receptor for ferrienterochelin and colicins